MIGTLARRVSHSLEMMSWIRAQAETPDFLSGSFFLSQEREKTISMDERSWNIWIFSMEK